MDGIIDSMDMSLRKLLELGMDKSLGDIREYLKKNNLETLPARREWQDILKVIKENNYSPDYCTRQGSHSNMKEKSKVLQTSKS